MRIKILTLLVFLSIIVNGQDINRINVQTKHVLPQNSGKLNRINLQKCINDAILSNNIELFFPKGDYKFEFSSNDSSIFISLIGNQNITFKGEGFSSKLIMTNENPSNNFSLFTISNNEKKCIVKIDKLHFIGPQNPGNNKENNHETHAINIKQGNLETTIDSVKVSGNFFKGIASSGGDNNYCRILKISKCELESYGAFSLGMFGAGTCNELICDSTLFLRCGLASNETTNKQAFGVSIYCHPDVSTDIKFCKFYDNHRNSIQFASGTKIYNKKYINPILSKTKYQVFENNYFDSTATDGIQLGFYYPNPIIKNNNFYNIVYGIEVVHGAIIENNYFGKTVASAITHTTESLVTNEKDINIYINNNQFHSVQAIYIYNNIKKRLCKTIYSNHNLYKCRGQGVSLGSAIVGDSSYIYFNSLKDTFHSSRNGCFFLGYSYNVLIDSPTVTGIRFIYVGSKPMNSSIMDSNSNVFINKLYCPANENYCATIFNNINGSKPKIVVYNSQIDSINSEKIVGNYSASKNNFIYPRDAKYPFDIITNSTIGQNINTNYNTYSLIGEGEIDNIILFNKLEIDPINDWKYYFTGLLKFTTKNKIKISTKGNIINSKIVPANSTFFAKWLRDLQKWEIITL